MQRQLPAITGRQLIRLLKLDGWDEVRTAQHGVWLSKQTRSGTRVATVKNTREAIPTQTLGQILGPKQTGLTRAGLGRLIEQHGLR